MTAKQLNGSLAPDGSNYITLTDGAGNLVSTTSLETLTVGTSQVSGGTNGSFLYDASGTLGNQTISSTNLTDTVGLTAWTPTDVSGASLTLTNGGCYYYRIGHIVCYFYNITYPTTADASNAQIGGLPYVLNTTLAAINIFPASLITQTANQGSSIANSMIVYQSSLFPVQTPGETKQPNSDMSGGTFIGAGWYLV